MTNYTWIATSPDSIADPLAWKPHSPPKAGDTATIATGVVLDAGKSTPAYYTIGNSNQAQTPKLKLSYTTALSGQVLGYAKFVNQGNSTLKFTLGSGSELNYLNPSGYLNLYNYGRCTET